MGGNRAVKQIKKACGAKGVNLSETGIVNWSHKQREEKIIEVIKKMSRF